MVGTARFELATSRTPGVRDIAEDHRSSTAASLLARKGFHKLYVVAGGTSAWIKAGYAVEESVDNS